jgi:hypothetical protein
MALGGRKRGLGVGGGAEGGHAPHTKKWKALRYMYWSPQSVKVQPKLQFELETELHQVTS